MSPDQNYNKSIVSAVGTAVLAGLRWAASGELNLDDEGLVVLGGAVTTLLVYGVSNFRRLRSYLRRP